MISDILSNKKANSIVTKLFIRGRKLNISLTFITQSFFSKPKNITLTSTHYLIMKIPSKQELQQITYNHSSDIELQNHIFFLVIDCTLASDNPLHFTKNLLERM